MFAGVRTPAPSALEKRALPRAASREHARRGEEGEGHRGRGNGDVKLFHRRQNKTLRHLPYLAPGTDSRKAAEAVAKRREAGETVGAIAEDLKASVATVRRMITGLALAHAIEAGEYDGQWKPADKQLVLSETHAKVA